MRTVLAFLIVSSTITFALSIGVSSARPQPDNNPTLTGIWRIRFILSGVEKNLVLNTHPKGTATLKLLDTGPDNKPVADPVAASWAQTTGGRISISTNVELPLGTCCREVGTLVFKGKFTSGNSISGTTIFIGSTEDEESILKFRAAVGTFVAAKESL